MRRRTFCCEPSKEVALLSVATICSLLLPHYREHPSLDIIVTLQGHSAGLHYTSLGMSCGCNASSCSRSSPVLKADYWLILCTCVQMCIVLSSEVEVYSSKHSTQPLGFVCSLRRTQLACMQHLSLLCGLRCCCRHVYKALSHSNRASS